MYSNTLPSRQLATWLCTAMIPVLLQLSGGIGWPVAAVAMVISTAAQIAVWKWGKPSLHPIHAFAQYVFAVLLLVQYLPYAAECWPGDNYPAASILLLVLAAWSVYKGESAAARVGCVLFWAVLFIYSIVCGAGVKEVSESWLRPFASTSPEKIPILLLLPCAAVILRKDRAGWNPRLLLPAAFLLVGTGITAGVLSPQRTLESGNPFYEMSRSLNVLGVAQRFEAVLSAGQTVGWFCMLTVLLSLTAAYAEKIKPTWGRKSLWVTPPIVTVVMLWNLHIPWEIIVILVPVFWVVIPILTQGLVGRKKS